MKSITVKFKNKPNSDGTLSTFTVDGCLVAPSGSPTVPRPRIIIHLPKDNDADVDGAWVNYEGNDYHVIGVNAPSMRDNTPTAWNRYALAERIY